ncbi:hypothetical protein HDU85_005222 [Gaertneriomyces sp. JEL0708]|nr:hypothetical protein HDU85_005222 [Gaertneriomyces sp. JEL0708]
MSDPSATQLIGGAYAADPEILTHPYFTSKIHPTLLAISNKPSRGTLETSKPILLALLKSRNFSWIWVQLILSLMDYGYHSTEPSVNLRDFAAALDDCVDPLRLLAGIVSIDMGGDRKSSDEEWCIGYAMENSQKCPALCEWVKKKAMEVTDEVILSAAEKREVWRVLKGSELRWRLKLKIYQVLTATKEERSPHPSSTSGQGQLEDGETALPTPTAAEDSLTERNEDAGPADTVNGMNGSSLHANTRPKLLTPAASGISTPKSTHDDVQKAEVIEQVQPGDIFVDKKGDTSILIACGKRRRDESRDSTPSIKKLKQQPPPTSGYTTALSTRPNNSLPPAPLEEDHLWQAHGYFTQYSSSSQKIRFKDLGRFLKDLDGEQAKRSSEMPLFRHAQFWELVKRNHPRAEPDDTVSWSEVRDILARTAKPAGK